MKTLYTVIIVGIIMVGIDFEFDVSVDGYCTGYCPEIPSMPPIQSVIQETPVIWEILAIGGIIVGVIGGIVTFRRLKENNIRK